MKREKEGEKSGERGRRKGEDGRKEGGKGKGRIFPRPQDYKINPSICQLASMADNYSV